jgi:hypothetical protein
MTGSFVRGFVLSGVVLFAPVLAAAFLLRVGIAAGWHDLPDVAFAAAVRWSWLLIPYWSLQPTFVSSGLGMLMATIQWLVVASAVGLLTRQRTVWVTIGIAIASVVGVGVAVPLIFWLFGYHLVFEGL